MSSNRQSKFIMWINYRIRVTTTDGRVFVGTFLAFDKHMNLVMSETEEYSRTKPKNKKNEEERKRTLGLVILRGDNVISFSAISQPGSTNKRFNDIKKINNENNENNDIKMDNNINLFIDNYINFFMILMLLHHFLKQIFFHLFLNFLEHFLIYFLL